VKSEVPQDCALGPCLFSTSVNDICAKIHFSTFISPDDIRMFHVKKLAEDCKFLQSDTDLLQEHCIENDVKINMHKTSIFSFMCKTNII
jgi:hypothetical protein